MSISAIFEDFSQGPLAPASSNVGSGDPLEGYETGYKAGWDDAVKAQLETKSHLTSSLVRNLEQVEFTLAEAQAAVLQNLKPVIDEVMDTLLPGLGEHALRSLLSEEIREALKSHGSGDIQLVISEQDESTVAALLNSSRELSAIEVNAKDTIAEGQAYVSCNGAKRKIDVSDAVSRIQEKLTSFLTQPELEQTHAAG